MSGTVDECSTITTNILLLDSVQPVPERNSHMGLNEKTQNWTWLFAMVNEIWFTFYFTHMASLFCYSFNKCKRMVRKAHVFSRERALRETFTLTRRAVPEPSSPGRLWDPWFTTQLESACINSAWKHSPSWACLKTNQTCLNQSFKKFRNFTQALKVTQKRMQSFLSLLSSLHFLSFSSYLYKKQRNAPVLVCSRSVPPTWRTRQVSKSQGNF